MIKAKLEKNLIGDFDKILKRIEDGILSESVSASLEDASDFSDGNIRCSVRVFERYSAVGSNRICLNVTLFQNCNLEIYILAMTSGGSQGILFKINTFVENFFG